jgi:3-dehydroquinate dehydratase / shikimate dehydrogenase
MFSPARCGDGRESVLTIGVLAEASSLFEAYQHGAKLDGFELRADLFPPADFEWLRAHFHVPILYTLRGKSYGGEFNGGLGERRRRLTAAARQFDLVDLEADQDLIPEILDAVPAHRRVITWHGPTTDCAGLERIFEGVSRFEAALYRIAPWTERPGDEIEPLLFLNRASHENLTAYARGGNGFWTRIVATYLGRRVLFACLQRGDHWEGEPSLRQLDDYLLSRFTSMPKELYGIVGNPAFHSLSPRLHNAAYAALGRPALYLPFEISDFTSFWRRLIGSDAFALLGLPMRGLTVASPHKEIVTELAHSVSVRSRRVQSANILFRDGAFWRTDTTDPEGVLLCLARREWHVDGRSVAVVGCGGAGRAVAHALNDAGAEVTLVNRGLERGERAVELLELPFTRLADFRAEGYSLVVNATPVGREGDEQPFSVHGLANDGVIADLVYGAQQTRLVSQAQARGIDVIDGREVLLTEVMCQFRLMTGLDMPLQVAHEVLGMGEDEIAIAAKHCI